jgi:hypothetical protein
MLPSGDPIWVRVQVAESAATGEQTAGPADVGLGERIAPAVDTLRLRGFAETVRGVRTGRGGRQRASKGCGFLGPK